MWKIVRVAVLVLTLIGAISVTWLDRADARDWDETLWVGIYPLAADSSAATTQYVGSLQNTAFASIETFFEREAQHYGVTLDRPVRVELYPAPANAPPVLKPGSGSLATIAWSLRMRWYAFRAPTRAGQPRPNIRMFVLYHDPRRATAVPHSLGLQKGLIGVVHAYGSRGAEGSNAVVIAHEVMHTLGATDKYDERTLLPRFPEGYGVPEQEPRWPQPHAEIMGGRRAVGEREAEVPDSLADVVVGPQTANEIAWGTP